MQKVKYTMSDFIHMKKEEIDVICQTIHDEANNLIAVATDFGYVGTDVTDLQTAINLYRVASGSPRQAIISKTLAIEQINSITRDVIDNNFVLGMDKMANTLLTTNPVFVSGYKHSREIINIGSTTAKVRGTIKNEEDIPLVGVRFYITITGVSQKVAETFSVTGGKFSITQILPNDYDLYWEFPNYLTKSETNVHIAAGKEIRRNITLLRVPPFTGTVSSGQIINVINISDPRWVPGITVKIKNTSSASSGTHLYFYPADNANDGYSGQGSLLLPGQEETHIIPAAEFKDFLNVQNQGPNSGSYEITIL